ncbi:MAG: ATP-dependent zinc metalloprotease FtsH [Candidatus Kapabacteria bacterium]|nr:ATP-dependent zinc metalloprotease FtsH [Candidatus Kapabacteria bacterium]
MATKNKSDNDGNQKNKNPFDEMRRMNKKNNDPNNIGRNMMIWLIIIASLVVTYMFTNVSQKEEPNISFTEYKRFLDQDMIKSVIILKSQLNDYELRADLKEKISIINNGRPLEIHRFSTKIGVIDSKVETIWETKGIKITYENSDGGFWAIMMTFLPWVVLLGFFVFFIRRMQMGGGTKGIFSFGKSRAKLAGDGAIKITFADVAGADEAKYELQEIIEFLKEPKKFQRLGGKIPKGVLLLGPPGTGKTLLARAVAGEAAVPFFSISGADFVEMFVGVGASRVRDLFENAKRNAPCLVFIDEIDAVGRHRGAGLGGGHDEREQTLNALLVEMDGFEQNSGIIIIAATNRPDVLDPALLRPGRFDRQVVVDRPDVKGREGIFKVHVKTLPLGQDVDLETLAKGTPGLSGADIANIVNEAALFAARRTSDSVTMFDFENAKDKVLMGVERKSMVISDKEKEMTSYHEMGHALVGSLVVKSDPVHKVTIIPRGRALGLTSYLPKEDYHALPKDMLEAKLVALMAGRMAEKLVFDSLSTGASSDIAHATAIARKMVCDWGMSEVLGPVSYATHQEEVFLGREISQPRDHSEETAQVIDNEVRKILLNASDVAEKLLSENMDLLHRASKILLEREILDGDELDIIIRGDELPPFSKNQLYALRSLNLNNNTENTLKVTSEN